MGLIAWLAALGCGTQIGEEEGLLCGEVGRVPLGVDEPSPEGVVAREVLDRALPYEADLEWVNLGTVTRVDVATTWLLGPIFHLTMENVDEYHGFGSREESVDACEDLVTVQVQSAVSSDDGLLAEVSLTEMQIDPDGSSLQLVDLTEPSGTFVAEDHADPTMDFDEYPSATIQLRFDPLGVGRGTVWVEGDGGRDGTWGRLVDGETMHAGSWPIVEEETGL